MPFIMSILTSISGTLRECDVKTRRCFLIHTVKQCGIIADKIKGLCKLMPESVGFIKVQGFSIIELLVALFIMTFGLLSVGQLLYVVASTGSLARSKGNAAVTAQHTLESLAALYRHNPSSEEFSPGDHGPRQIHFTNPETGTAINRYAVSWTASPVHDPRPGKKVKAILLRVTVTPIQSDGAENNKPTLNKTISVTTIVSPRMR